MREVGRPLFSCIERISTKCDLPLQNAQMQSREFWESISMNNCPNMNERRYSCLLQAEDRHQDFQGAQKLHLFFLYSLCSGSLFVALIYRWYAHMRAGREAKVHC